MNAAPDVHQTYTPSTLPRDDDFPLTMPSPDYIASDWLDGVRTGLILCRCSSRTRSSALASTVPLSSPASVAALQPRAMTPQLTLCERRCSEALCFG